ncbi:hypothetical protein niasHT_033046 [Heterodera trifolii]|uniref:SLC41A/MgtE integral membrane domain-containing protein n=1 Tax=Heterodera trifolii TaxID=157864 RepID=A0ABD2IUY8_9BILA
MGGDKFSTEHNYHKSSTKQQQANIMRTSSIRIDRVGTVEQPGPKNSFSEPSKVDECAATPSAESNEKQQSESSKSFFIQTFVPFLVAGCGMVAAGLLLDQASGWLFLSEVPEALILVPALLGLKGNLEMTLASRLSTRANLGLLDQPQQQLTTLYSNVALVQTQAIVVALIASVLAVGTHWVDGNSFDFARSVCVVLSGTVSASITSFMLTSLMVCLVIMARRLGLNPDNIATPLAAATGDVASLAFLILFGTWFYRIRDQHLATLITVLVALIASAPAWGWLAVRVRDTRVVLKHGWYAILTAMLISTGGGYVLRHAINQFAGIGLFQPVINGVGGNLVAVQASKLSTSLHRFGKLGILPAHTLLTYVNPLRTFACKETESNNALILLLMSVPGHLLFIGLLLFTGEMDGQALNLPFMAIYLCATTLQVATLLYCCQLLCRCLWRLRWDPNVNAIPLLTALGDFLGTTLLAIAFLAHAELFPEYSVNGTNCTNGPIGQQDAVEDAMLQVVEQQLLLGNADTTLATETAELMLLNRTL